MPKILPYPLDALRKCLELADAISDVGGVCEKNECAEKMGKSLSGAFQTLRFNGKIWINKKYKAYVIYYGFISGYYACHG